VGLQPGDLTKHMALPWQADFNECTTQPINVTYEDWNKIYPASEGDSLMKREEKVWETLWWPAHRPLQVWEPFLSDGQLSYRWVDWSRGIPQTNAGDLKMVTEWWKLSFVIENPAGSAAGLSLRAHVPGLSVVLIEASCVGDHQLGSPCSSYPRISSGVLESNAASTSPHEYIDLISLTS
jgi:L-lysine epsilon oxidase-like protein